MSRKYIYTNEYIISIEYSHNIKKYTIFSKHYNNLFHFLNNIYITFYVYEYFVPIGMLLNFFIRFRTHFFP